MRQGSQRVGLIPILGRWIQNKRCAAALRGSGVSPSLDYGIASDCLRIIWRFFVVVVIVTKIRHVYYKIVKVVK